MSARNVSEVPRTLTELPNITVALADDLRRIGVASPRDLLAVGAERAWTRVCVEKHRDCIQTLLALAGATLGVTWDALPAERRFELMRYAADALAGADAAVEKHADDRTAA